MLNVNDHRRDSAGLKYVYPVVSRRAGGVSVGINLNTNNACNWACVYCQVPDLVRGGPLPVDLPLLEKELRGFLHEAIEGDFMLRNVPAEMRQLVDVAFSGNGEPTSATEFADAVVLVEQVLREFSLLDLLKVRLITNGSLMHRPQVKRGIALIGAMNGEVWFKLDRASETGIATVNGAHQLPERVKLALLECAALASTWVQTCYFAMDGCEASDEEQSTYLEFVASVSEKIKGVHLYGLARPSLQPGAERLSSFPAETLERFARKISALGIEVVINP